LDIWPSLAAWPYWEVSFSDPTRKGDK